MVRFWANLLESFHATDRGRLFIQNLAFDVDAGRLSPRDIDSLLDDALALSQKLRGRKDTNPLTLLAKILTSSRRLLLGAQSTPESTTYYVVTSLDYPFLDRYVDLSEYGGKRKFCTPAQHWDFIKTIQPTYGFPFRSGANLRGSQPMVWLGRANEIDAALGGTPLNDCADRARDYLGLPRRTEAFSSGDGNI